MALAGDPDQLISLTEFLVSMDMWPIHIVTGTPGKKFEARIKEITKDVPHPVNVKAPATCSCCTSGSKTTRWTC